MVKERRSCHQSSRFRSSFHLILPMNFFCIFTKMMRV
ncbi:hypothetical protein EYW48_04195 [Vibrio sp. 1180_3]|nr:hypothetical protein [Vibrio sp. 1180_3]